MSLSEALEYARAHHPQVRSALAELAARRAEARVPRAAWLPQIGATAQVYVGTANNTTALYVNVPELDIPRVGAAKSVTSTHWSPSGSTIAAIGLGQEVYDFGRIAAQIAVADAVTEISRANYALTDLDIQLGVEEAYHGVLAAKEVLKATEEALKRAVTHRDFALAGTKSGLRPPIDLTRAEADVARLEVNRIRAQSGLEVSQAALAGAIGSNAIAVDAAEIAPDTTPAPAFEEALRTAAQKNPIIAQAMARVRAQKSTTNAITHEILPNLSATATLSGRAGGVEPSSGGVPYGSGWLPDVGNWDVGLILQWNIFDGMVLARRSASKAREAATLADLDLAKISALIGTEKAYLDLDAALKALPGLAQSVGAARANEAQAEARFRAGLGTIIELADAEAVLINAQLEFAVGQFTVARARAALGRAMGASFTRTPLPTK